MFLHLYCEGDDPCTGLGVPKIIIQCWPLTGIWFVHVYHQPLF